MKKLRKLLCLRSRDYQLLLTTTIVLGLIRLGLWLLPFRSLYQYLKKLSPTSTQLPEADWIVTRKVVWSVNAVAERMPIPAKCLARALTTQLLLAQQGYRTELRIGVAKNEQEKLEAHAWVESKGEIIIGRLVDISKYTLLPSLDKVT